MRSISLPLDLFQEVGDDEVVAIHASVGEGEARRGEADAVLLLIVVEFV